MRKDHYKTIKKCGKCQEYKKKEDFGKNAYNRDNLADYCKICAKEASRAHSRKHKKRLRPDREAYRREYYKKYKIKLLKKDKIRFQSMTKEQRAKYNEDQRRRYHAKKNDTPVESKRCSRCKKIKPAKDFTIEKKATSGLRSSCKECKAKDQRDLRRKRKTMMPLKDRIRKGLSIIRRGYIKD